MAEFIKVARCDELTEGSGMVVEANGRKIALFNAGGQFYAIANECHHRGAPLGKGTVYGTRVICPRHGWEYDFATGCNVDDPSIRLRRFTVKVEAGDVLIAT
jgi:3-phenylpropionate/trans-cinnamate dioxygenase ferredoxin component